MPGGVAVIVVVGVVVAIGGGAGVIARGVVGGE